MRKIVDGEDKFSPELFDRARAMVWHYGLFTIGNDRSGDLKDHWFRDNGEDSGCLPGDPRQTRILVLAGRSLFLDEERHVCDEGCVGLPESMFV